MKETISTTLKSIPRDYPYIKEGSLVLSSLVGLIGVFTIVFLLVFPVNAKEKNSSLQVESTAGIGIHQICMNVSLDPNFVELSCIDLNK